jgi:SNF family Na+-dependent transporter
MKTTERWGSRLGLVLAMAGNAVGLGNFLRFPAQASLHGGGAFILPYLVSFVLMGIPLLWVEWAIGRHGGAYGHHSAPGMLDRLGKQGWLKYVGVFGLFSNLTIAAYYCYIESWTLSYVFHSIIGTFRHTLPTDFLPRYLGLHEESILALPHEAVFWFLLTLALNVWILSRGLAKGIELAAKIGMPLLVVFGAVLAVRGLTLGRNEPGVIESPLVGLDFLWRPRPEGLLDPSTWLAAASQIFFTLSVGLGCVQCYASYVRSKQDIALTAATAGWTNEFVEVILGGSILIPIATAYLGLQQVQSATASGSGFSLGFLTLPTLFNNWGWFAPVAGAFWFGLLFFAGITSSLAMGQPVMAFLEDEYGWRRRPAALAFGASTLALGMFCVWLYPGGAFDEFDFWIGTVSLVVFALGESLIFAFIFGLDRGWEEITRGADMKVPHVFRFVIKYVTPAFLLAIFVAALIKPEGNWGTAIQSLFSGGGWPFAPDSVIGKVLHVGIDDRSWFDAQGRVTPVLVRDITRMLLIGVFAFCAFLVWKAWRGKVRRAS